MPRAVPLVAAAIACAIAAAPASARDYSGTALNIVPSGQWGSLPVPAGADEQARMYDALTPLFDQVTDADLQKDFKSAKLGGAPAPTRTETVPRKGVKIVRDKFNVPHITGRNHDDVTWAMGWVLQEDRGLLLQQGRNPGRIAALDTPGIRAFDLVVGLKPFTPTKQADRLIERQQVGNLKRAGKQGRAVLHDIDMFIAGINAKMKADKLTTPKFKRVDIFGFIALAGELFGRGGGDEARRSAFFDGLRDKLGAPQAQSIFDDLSERNDPDRPDTMSKTFATMGGRSTPGPGNAILDHGSYQPVVFPTSAAARAAVTEPEPAHASNFLMVAGRRSTNGHPLFVAGPQIGYYYPGLTLEADIKWPGHAMRGVYSPAHPGVVFIGRGEDFAYSLTSAGNDTADQFAEELCGSDTRYRYKGKCRTMQTVNVGVTGSTKISYRATVHGPVTGYATVGGKRVAITRKRASAGRDAMWMLPFRDATFGRVRSAEDLYKAANKQPYTFNVAYADDRDIATFSAGRIPKRDPRVDQRFPTVGTGQYEWRGFISGGQHPQQKNPPSGALVNWNNRAAPGFAAADDDWEHGSLHRVEMLNAGIAKQDKHTLASVTSAMNAAATTDLRSFGLTSVLGRILSGGPAPSARAAAMLGQLEAWRASGSSRLDRDGDGAIDAGAAPAIWDELYPRLVDAVFTGPLGPELEDEFKGLAGRRNSTASGFTGGAINHVHKDLSAIAGLPLKKPFTVRYCGGGDVNACRDLLWKALDDTGAALEAKQGTADPLAWKADANAERITFAPGLLPLKIRYTNRPSGIQQVITFTGHRPKR